MKALAVPCDQCGGKAPQRSRKLRLQVGGGNPQFSGTLVCTLHKCRLDLLPKVYTKHNVAQNGLALKSSRLGRTGTTPRQVCRNSEEQLTLRIWSGWCFLALHIEASSQEPPPHTHTSHLVVDYHLTLSAPQIPLLILAERS